MADGKTYNPWIGRVMSGLPAAALIMSSTGKLSQSEQIVKALSGELGFKTGSITTIGVLEIASAILYLVPQTAILGAILLTGYLGGAVASHVRVGDDKWMWPILFGVLLWGGLWFRDARVRALLPMRRPE